MGCPNPLLTCLKPDESKRSCRPSFLLMETVFAREELPPRMAIFQSMRRSLTAESHNVTGHISLKVVLGNLTLIPHTVNGSQITPNGGTGGPILSFL